MGGWFDALVAACRVEHDELCADGARCETGEQHVTTAYVPHALREEVDRLLALLHEAGIDPKPGDSDA